MEKSKYELCPSDSTQGVYHIELEHRDKSRSSDVNGEARFSAVSDEVVMRNAVSPDKSGRKRSEDHRSSSMTSERKSDDVHHEKDDNDGPDIFSEESVAPLMNTNQYQMRKMAAQTLMDVALMMANISQLRTLIALGDSLVQYYPMMLTCVVFSLTCQLIFAILMFIMWIRESSLHQKHDFLENLKKLEESKGISVTTIERVRRSMANRQHDFLYNQTTSRLNYVSMILVFIITVTNMFITGFGIKTVEKS